MPGAVQLTKNADPDKYSYWEQGVGFYSCSPCSFPNFHWGKNFLMLRVKNSWLDHIDNKEN